MNKAILEQYIDACALVEETNKEIQRIRQRSDIIHDVVKGSMDEFPYSLRQIHIEGVADSHEDDARMKRELKLLEERKEQAAAIKTQAEEWLNTIPPRMQRIIRMKVFEGKTWERIADNMGRCATGDSVRKEYQRFFQKK